MVKVSVIIPTLNEESHIAACIQSAAESGADEIIISDAGSTDRTVEIAAQSAAVFAGTPGRAAQQNHGALQATGDVYLFLHADCLLSASAISSIRQAMVASPKTVAGCFRQNIDQPGLKYKLLAAGNALRVKLFRWAYGDQGIFVRSDVFETVGRFPDVNFLEDLLLMKKLKQKGNIELLPDKLHISARRWESRGVLRQTFRNMLLVAASQLGISPNRLAKFYPNER